MNELAGRKEESVKAQLETWTVFSVRTFLFKLQELSEDRAALCLHDSSQDAVPFLCLSVTSFIVKLPLTWHGRAETQ